MQEKIEILKKQFAQALESVKTFEQLENLRVKALGKKGYITQIIKDFRDLSQEDKKVYGK